MTLLYYIYLRVFQNTVFLKVFLAIVGFEDFVESSESEIVCMYVDRFWGFSDDLEGLTPYLSYSKY